MSQSSKEKYVIGVDIGGSHVSSAVVDLTSRLILNGVITTTPVDCHGDATVILDAWASNIMETAARNGLKVAGIGFAFPGPFDYRKGISQILGVQKFENIYGLNVTESLYPLLADIGAADFRYVNDASAFALGECLGGAGRGGNRVLTLTLGTGLGSGFIVDNKPVDSGEGVPENGWVYCLPFEGGIADDAFSSRWMVGRYRELTGKTVEGAKQIADNAAGGDAAAIQLFEEYGDRLAGFAAPVMDRFRGDTLILGGNIARAYGLFGPALEKGFSSGGRKIDIKTSTLIERAAIVGAGSLFIQHTT